MNTKPIDDLVNALLYEGYLLYPYRRSALKNQYPWMFGYHRDDERCTG